MRSEPSNKLITINLAKEAIGQAVDAIMISQNIIEDVTRCYTNILRNREELFCDIINDGYLARNKDGYVYWYTDLPKRGESQWLNVDNNPKDAKGNLQVFITARPEVFDFITWDTEPFEIIKMP